MNIPYEVQVQIVWKKGKSHLNVNFILVPISDQKRLETKTNPSLGVKGSNKCDFKGENMSMISSIMKDKKDGKFTEKTSSLVVKIIKGEK